MKTITALIAASLLWAGLPSYGEEVLELPSASKLRPVSGPDQAGVVAFEGTTALHGIFVAQWEAGGQADGSPGPRYRILPVVQSAAQMPHFKGAPLRFIEVPNGEEFLARATSGEIAERFAQRKIGVLHVEGIFSIEHLKIGEGCAAAGSAEVLEVDAIRVRFPARPEPIGCRAPS